MLLTPAALLPAQTLTDFSMTLTQIVSALDQPIGIEFLSVNDLLVLKKATGKMKRVINGIIQPGVAFVEQIPRRKRSVQRELNAL